MPGEMVHLRDVLANTMKNVSTPTNSKVSQISRTGIPLLTEGTMAAFGGVPGIVAAGIQFVGHVISGLFSRPQKSYQEKLTEEQIRRLSAIRDFSGVPWQGSEARSAAGVPEDHTLNIAKSIVGMPVSQTPETEPVQMDEEARKFRGY